MRHNMSVVRIQAYLAGRFACALNVLRDRIPSRACGNLGGPVCALVPGSASSAACCSLLPEVHSCGQLLTISPFLHIVVICLCEVLLDTRS